MTHELHTVIVRIALGLLLEHSDQEIADLVGLSPEYPVRGFVHWCYEHPDYPDEEFDKAVKVLLEKFAKELA